MFQYGVLEINDTRPLHFQMVEEPVDGLDTALYVYKKYTKLFPSRKFKLVRIEYKEMEVFDT
jgi:hypothetical protein